LAFLSLAFSGAEGELKENGEDDIHEEEEENNGEGHKDR